MIPVLGGEIVERQRRILIFRQAVDRLGIRLGLHLDRMRKQFARAAAKYIRQGIIDFVGLTKANNVLIVSFMAYHSP